MVVVLEKLGRRARRGRRRRSLSPSPIEARQIPVNAELADSFASISSVRPGRISLVSKYASRSPGPSAVAIAWYPCSFRAAASSSNLVVA